MATACFGGLPVLISVATFFRNACFDEDFFSMATYLPLFGVRVEIFSEKCLTDSVS